MNYEIHNDSSTCNLLDPVDCAAADKKSDILDTSGVESAEIIVSLGLMTGGDADNYVTPVLQESDTTADADFTTVAAGDVEGAFTAVTAALANYSAIQRVGYKGTKRYVRVLLDYTISGGGAPVTALLASVTAVCRNLRTKAAAANITATSAT